MTRINALRNTRENFLTWGKNASALVFAAALIICSVTVGCSNDKPKPVTSNIQIPAAQPQAQPMPATPVAQSENKPSPKKPVVRKRLKPEHREARWNRAEITADRTSNHGRFPGVNAGSGSRCVTCPSAGSSSPRPCERRPSPSRLRSVALD